MMQRCMGVLGRTEANLQPQQFTDTYAIPRWAVESVKYVSGRTDFSGQAVMGGSGGRFSRRTAIRSSRRSCPSGACKARCKLRTLQRAGATRRGTTA